MPETLLNCPPLSKTGPPLYSNIVRNIWHSTNLVSQQKNSIGKALWHQFTVVVLLTQNMRQKSQSEEDAKFRKLLVNLRMRSCDRDDIELMHSRVPRDVHASVITRRNVNRDLLNEVGSLRFARDKKVALHTFYAVDTYSNAKIAKKDELLEMNPLRSGNVIPKEQADKILDIPPVLTLGITGKLIF